MIGDKIIKAMEGAWKLLGAIEQNPRRRYLVASDRDNLFSAIGDVKALLAVHHEGVPAAGKYVLAWMEGRKTPIRAMWVPAFWLEAGDECPEVWAEYSEEKGEYFCPEGWYENNEHEETHFKVNKPIVAWMDLPRLEQAPQEGGAA